MSGQFDRYQLDCDMARAIIVLIMFLCGAAPAVSTQERPAVPSRAAIEHNGTGVAFMNQDLFKEAAAAFRKALATDPSFSLARVNLGIALFYSQDLEEALQILSEADAREPENPYVLFTLG